MQRCQPWGFAHSNDFHGEPSASAFGACGGEGAPPPGKILKFRCSVVHSRPIWVTIWKSQISSFLCLITIFIHHIMHYQCPTHTNNACIQFHIYVETILFITKHYTICTVQYHEQFHKTNFTRSDNSIRLTFIIMHFMKHVSFNSVNFPI